MYDSVLWCLSHRTCNRQLQVWLWAIMTSVTSAPSSVICYWPESCNALWLGRCCLVYYWVPVSITCGLISCALGAPLTPTLILSIRLPLADHFVYDSTIQTVTTQWIYFNFLSFLLAELVLKTTHFGVFFSNLYMFYGYSLHCVAFVELHSFYCNLCNLWQYA